MHDRDLYGNEKTLFLTTATFTSCRWKPTHLYSCTCCTSWEIWSNGWLAPYSKTLIFVMNVVIEITMYIYSNQDFNDVYAKKVQLVGCGIIPLLIVD